MTGPISAPPAQRAPVPAWTPGTTPATRPAQDGGLLRGWLLGGIAFVLALMGLSLLGAEPGRTWGSALLIVAGVLAVLAWGGIQPSPAFGVAVTPAAPGAQRRRRLALAGIAGAGALTGGADLLFLAQPNETFGLAGVLWLLGTALLLAAAASWPRPERSSVLQTLAAGARPEPSSVLQTAADPPRWTHWEVVGLVGLTALALLLRAWDLTGIPANIYPDEIMTGTVATQAYLGGPNPSVFSTLWGDINLPALWFFLVAGFIKIGGPTLAMLRLPAALFGAATVVPFYGLVRETWGRVAAIAGSAILAFSAADLGYSRVALNNILPQFFWAACFFFLLRGLRRRRPLDWALAGVLGGLSEYGYYGTHLLPFVLLAFAGYLLLVHWRQARTLVGHWALLALGYLIAFGPLLAYYLSHPTLYFGRATSILTWNHFPTSWADFQAMVGTLWPLFAGTLLGISTLPSQDLVYFGPLLLAGEAALLVLGTALLIWHWRHPAAFLLLLSGVGTLFVGGTLVLYSPPPFLAHWTPGFPAFYAALAVPVACALRGGGWGLGAGGWGMRIGSRLTFHVSRFTLQAAGLGLLLLVLGWLNWDYYFHRYYADPGLLAPKLQAPQMHYEVQAAQARWQAALGPRYAVYMVGRTAQPYDATFTGYLAADQAVGFVRDPPADYPPSPPTGQRLAFVFYPDTVQYRDEVAARYPGGVPGEVRSPAGRTLFYTYVLPPGG